MPNYISIETASELLKNKKVGNLKTLSTFQLFNFSLHHFSYLPLIFNNSISKIRTEFGAMPWLPCEP
jgi:hypothetical protein